MIRCTVLLLASQGAADRTMASAPTRATEASAMKLPRSVRKTAMIRMGNSSPTAPAAYTYWPNGPPSMSDVGRLGQAEHMGADQDAADQQDDYLGNARAGQDGDDERRECGHHRHGHQVHKSLVKVHDGRLIGRVLGGRSRDTGPWCRFGGGKQDGCPQADQADEG